MISRSSHVVVVGGGIVGCAIAFVLARAGVRVTLIEPDPFGAHASGKNPGNLNPILNTSASLMPLALDSFRRHIALAGELAALGCKGYALAPVERILLAFEEPQCKQLQDTSQLWEGREGFSGRLLDPKAVRKLVPGVSEDMRAGLLISGNMSVDSRELVCALGQGAARLGAEIVHGRVDKLETASGRVTGVRVAGGGIACDAIVLATGPWVAETRTWLGMSLPVELVKGQMLKMRLPGAGPRYDLSHGEISLYRRGDDEIWVGVTKEQAGLDETPTEQGRAYLMAGAIRILPDMARAILLEHCASVRPQGPSGLPIVGEAPGLDNVYVANGGGIKGVLLSMGIAQAIHDLLLAGRSALPLNLPAV